MSDLRVEKKLLAAALRLTDGSRLEGTLFLSTCSPAHAGLQTVDELMEEPELTLPFRLGSGGFVLVGKARIAAVEIAGAEVPELSSRVPARLTLSGGHVVEGAILVEEGFGHRLSDRLNSRGGWLPVDTSGAVVWVAKHHLLTLIPDDI